MRCSRSSATARAASAPVCPLSRRASTASSNDSKAEITRVQPPAASGASRSRCAIRCSTLIVASKVTRGNSPFRASTTRRAWVGPLRKSGSPNETWVAPQATCWRMSAITTSTGTARKRPRYTGTTGQWRHRWRQPRLASVNATWRSRPSGSSSRAYLPRSGSALRSGTRKSPPPRNRTRSPPVGSGSPRASACASASRAASTSPPSTVAKPLARSCVALTGAYRP